MARKTTPLEATSVPVQEPVPVEPIVETVLAMTVWRPTLLAALKVCKSACDKSSMMPALSNVLLTTMSPWTAQPGVCATDLYQWVCAPLPKVEHTFNGAICVSLADLIARVEKMPADVMISFHGKKTTQPPWRPGEAVAPALHELSMSGGRVKYTLPAMPAEDFPAIVVPGADDRDSSIGDISRAKLMDVFDRCEYAISRDETHANMNALCLEFPGNALRATASDGHRLHRSEVAAPGTMPARKGPTLVSLDAVLGALKAFPKPHKNEPDIELVLYRNDKHFWLGSGDMLFGTKVVDDDPPPHDHVLKSVLPNQWITLGTDELCEAIHIAAVAASDRTACVRLDAVPGHLKVSAESFESGSGSIELDVEHSCRFAAGFNSKYLLAAIRGCNAARVRIGIKDTDHDPVIIAPDDKSIAVEHRVVTLVMPMRL
jgi:DNA polymerase III sliding clamp (beta) subunit (PCNA family)